MLLISQVILITMASYSVYMNKHVEKSMVRCVLNVDK
jgi:hypothetical protein